MANTTGCEIKEARSGSAGARGSETVLDEYIRLDKTIRDCEHALLIAERLNVRGRPLAESAIEPVRRKLQETLIERDFLDEWINRRGKSPNDEMRDRSGSGTSKEQQASKPQ
jgi:hypothetical protein